MIIVKEIDIEKLGEDSLLSITFCNEGKSKYYLDEIFMYSPRGLMLLKGFNIYQNGEKANYKGKSYKRAASKFPEGFILFEPGDCKGYNVMLNKFFDFDQDKEIELFFSIGNYNPISKKIDRISFESKFLIGDGSDK